MEDAVLPKHTISTQQLPEDIEYLRLFEQPLLPKQIMQRSIFTVLHEDIEIIFREAFDWENPNQIGMIR
jgi:hypothetical protein